LWLCEARTVEIVAGALSAGHYTMIPPDGTDPRCGLRVATAELSKKAGRHSGQRYAASRDRHLAAWRIQRVRRLGRVVRCEASAQPAGSPDPLGRLVRRIRVGGTIWGPAPNLDVLGGQTPGSLYSAVGHCTVGRSALVNAWTVSWHRSRYGTGRQRRVMHGVHGTVKVNGCRTEGSDESDGGPGRVAPAVCRCQFVCEWGSAGARARWCCSCLLFVRWADSRFH